MKRLTNRLLDPETGKYWNMELDPCTDEAISERLVAEPSDEEDLVREAYKRFLGFNSKFEEFWRHTYLMTING